MGTQSANSGTWSVVGSEHTGGREWGYRYHLGATDEVSPAYHGRGLRDDIIAAAQASVAQQSLSPWLAALPNAVESWVAGYSTAIQEAWRDQDAEP